MSRGPQTTQELATAGEEEQGPSITTNGEDHDDDDAAHASPSPRAWPPPLTASQSTPQPLTPHEYSRYGRQMILPGFGLAAQLALRSARVLVIGAGGLGCPAIQYLAACGVGHITVVDHDVVERSNLSRQILHTDARIGVPKVDSVRAAVSSINPFVHVNAVREAFTVDNALPLVRDHDVVLDCTDNPLTRYLTNDAAVIAGKPLVSGAGQGYEGQLIVFDRDSDSSPCYRCLFPVAPRPSEVKDCAETGVLGIVTGLVGTLQATEAIKLITRLNADDAGEPSRPTMLLVNPLDSARAFRTIKIRPRRPACRVCSNDTDGMSHRITANNIHKEDYIAFCGLQPTTDTASPPPSVRSTTARELADARSAPALLLDVRTREEFSIVRLQGSVNIPWSDVRSDPRAAMQTIEHLLASKKAPRQVHVLCLKGNDSLLAAELLQKQQQQSAADVEFIDVKGGLREWRRLVDIDLPEY